MVLEQGRPEFVSSLCNFHLFSKYSLSVWHVPGTRAQCWGHRGTGFTWPPPSHSLEGETVNKQPMNK